MEDNLYPPIDDSELSDDSDSDSDSETTECEIRVRPVTQIEITRDMEKWMEMIQIQYETYRDNAVTEIVNTLSLESI